MAPAQCRRFRLRVCQFERVAPDGRSLRPIVREWEKAHDRPSLEPTWPSTGDTELARHMRHLVIALHGAIKRRGDWSMIKAHATKQSMTICDFVRALWEARGGWKDHSPGSERVDLVREGKRQLEAAYSLTRSGRADRPK